MNEELSAGRRDQYASGSALSCVVAKDLGLRTMWYSGASQAAPSYDLTVTSSALLRVVDCCVIGDQFAIYIDSAHAFDTSPIVNNDGVESGAFDGDTAWANADLSKGSILLGAGVYHIDEWVIRNALGTEQGGAFIRADVLEPGTFGLLSLALGGLATMLVRRRK